MDFQEAERRYAEIKRRHEAGTITDEEFDEQLKQLMVQDQEERWWAKSRRTGDWHYYDGTTWIKDTPPSYEPLQAAPQVPSPPRGGPRTPRPQAPTSPRTKLLRWLAPVAFVGLVIMVVAIARNTGGGGGTATPTPTSGNLPYSDDFSHPSGAWSQVKGKDAGNYYDDGGYRIYSQARKTRAILPAPLRAGRYQDVTVEVDAKVLNSQTDFIASGVLCRAQDPDNYYSMLVSGDGFVAIFKRIDGHLHKIAGGDRSELIGKNVVSPHIRGDCVGNSLTLYVDDQEVIEAEDSAFRNGDAGLFVASFDPEVGPKVLFDNFSVKKP